MEAIEQVQQLVRQGRFADAKAALDAASTLRIRTPEVECLRVQVLERLGAYAEAEETSLRLLRGRTTPLVLKSICEFTLGMVRWDRGLTTEAIGHFQKSSAFACEAGDLTRQCWAEIRLLVAVGGKSDGVAASKRLSEVRRLVIRLGDPVVSAALHIFIGEIEAKRGLLAIAARHTTLGLALLQHAPNLWLESVAANNRAAIALIRRDLEEALAQSELALRLGRDSGAAAIQRAALANLGNVEYLRGCYGEARKLLAQSLHLLPSSGEYSNGSIDSLARTYLEEGDLEQASRHLAMVDAAVRRPEDWVLYSNRYALLSRTELLVAQNDMPSAELSAKHLVQIARDVGDAVLETAALAKLAEICAVTTGQQDAISLLTDLADRLQNGASPQALADYEHAIAKALDTSGAVESATTHRSRALRITSTYCRSGKEATRRNAREPEHVRSEATLQETATTLMHAGRPELVAVGLLAIARQMPCITAAAAVSVSADGHIETLDGFGALDAAPATRTFSVGVARQRSVELRIGLLADLESHATVNSIGFMLAAIHELERGRLEREERLTLWPVDELPAEDDDSVVTGKMRDIMIFARRIAPNPVTVLVTGESGTGKEVLARAIHRYSPRAAKPFIPFNCTAVPRELLESQLFGHKRGAFTGADRDNPGLIRAARDGTLFLDEIGELSLDLQPKLLRFLESNEISPLGDPTPVRVDVRVIAATNAKLEQLVAAGRFREDLFYRLNVVEIALPPLRERRDEIQPLAHNLTAKAAYEFGKGRVTVGDELMAHLLVYPWPGNVRQLNNELRRMVAIVDPDTRLTPDHLPRTLRSEIEEIMRRENGLEISIRWTEGLDQTVARIEREMIRAALARCHGRVEAAAKALGISRKGLYLKRRRLGV